MQIISIILKTFQVLIIAVILLVSPVTAVITVGYLIFRQMFSKSGFIDILVFVITIFLDYSSSGLILGYTSKVISNYNSMHLIDFFLYQVTHIDFAHQFDLLALIWPVSAINFIQEFVNKHNHLKKTPNSEKLIKGVLLTDDNQVILEDAELNQHTLIIGTTGSGKTTTLMNFVESSARRNIPLIFLDGKGSSDLIDKMAQIAHNYQRKFKVFTLRPRKEMKFLAGYNPFATGNATEWKNRIMSLFAAVEGKGQEHFSLGEQNYINFVANILAQLPTKVDLRVFLAFLENPDKLLAVAHDQMPEIGKKLAKLNADSELSVLIGDVVKLLELFIYSDYGHLFNTFEMENVINIQQSIVNKEMILFQFDASSYPEDTKKIAKIVINDINSTFAGFTEFTKCYCIFDEFASYASSNLAETISLHRSNGMHAVIGTQSIETVKLKSPETKRIAEELLACCNTYIVHTINLRADANTMADIMGNQKQYDVSLTISNDKDSSASDKTNKNVKIIDAPKISPDQMMELKTGEAIIYRKSISKAPHKIKIRQLR